MESQVRLTVVLGFLHSLYTLPEVIVPISGVHLSETFRYLYSYSGEILNSLESQLRLISGIRISGIPYYILPEVIVPILWCTLFETFRYFYC